MLTREQKEKQLILIREKKIRSAKTDFWNFCKVDAPDFYKESRWHLVIYSYVLQALYERTLTKEYFYEICEKYAPEWFVFQFDWDRLQDGYVFTKLMINMPPSYGEITNAS